MTIDLAGVPECLSCGTCCFSETDNYLRVWGADFDRMGDTARALTEFRGNACYMRMTDGHCAALVPDPIAKTFACSIYEQRPDCCRVFERGGGGCRADRHDKGDRPHILLEQLLAGPRNLGR